MFRSSPQDRTASKPRRFSPRCSTFPFEKSCDSAPIAWIASISAGARPYDTHVTRHDVPQALPKMAGFFRGNQRCANVLIGGVDMSKDGRHSVDDIFGDAPTKHEAFQERVAGQPVRSVNARGGTFSARPQAVDRRPSVRIRGDPAHVIVGSGCDGNGGFFYIVPERRTRSPSLREALGARALKAGRRSRRTSWPEYRRSAIALATTSRGASSALGCSLT